MKTKKKLHWLFLLLFITVACSSDPEVKPTPPTPPEPPQTEIKEGFNISPEKPDADEELTITFKAAKSTPLHGYSGDVYAHTGVVSEGEWMFVPAEWNQNIAKCKMTKVEDNVWSIKYSPTIRQWFGSGETAINKIGIVIRSADGSKKGIDEDYFVTVTDSKYKAFEPGAVKNQPLPAELEHGINIIDNNTVTLVLYDKDKYGGRKDFAHVVGDFNDWTLSNTEKSQMYRDEAAGTWWITITGLDSSKEHAFQYYVGTKGKDGETIRLADPYSRKILDPNNDKYITDATYPEKDRKYPEGGVGIVSVFKTIEDTYNWEVPNFEAPELGNMVIYEMLFRDFTTSGDINGAMQKLDYLQSLGVNAIELMPVQEFDGNDSWGYNPAFFFAMDKAYGTDRMYKEFIDACHERGMAVILDVVYNHATGAHPFAKLYWDSSNNKTAARNPWFNVDAPHPYSVFHDFNHESDLVRDFVKRNLTFLLEEYNIDGFRFDLTKGFTQNSSTESTASNYDADRVRILKDYNATIKAVKPETYVILEHFCDNKEETELSEDGMMVWRNMNNSFKQSAMGKSTSSDFSGLYYGTSRPVNSLVSYMESHDEERTAYMQTKEGIGVLKTNLAARMSQLSANAAFFFTVPGPKMIWQFGELGYDISINSDINGNISKDNRTSKKPIKWEYFNEPERKKVHDTYAKLMALRNEHPELFTSSATLNLKVSSNYWNNGRFLTLTDTNSNKHLVVIGNFTNNKGTFSTTFPRTGEWFNYMNTTDTIIDAKTADIDVPANSFKIYTSFSTPE